MKELIYEVKALIGEVQATPTANTVLDRLKTIAGHVDSLEGYFDGVETTLTSIETLLGEPADRNITQISGTSLTGRDWSGDLQALIDDSIKGLLRSLGDAGASPTNSTGRTLLNLMTLIYGSVDNLEGYLDTVETLLDEPADRNITQISGTALTGRDWSLDFKALIDDSVKGVLRTLGDAGATPTNATGNTVLKLLDLIKGYVDQIEGYVDALETLLAGGLPAVLDAGALKIKEQSPISGFATSAKQDTIIGHVDGIEGLLGGGVESHGDPIFNIESVVSDTKSNLDASEGANTLNSDAVPAGKIWVITHVMGFNGTSAATLTAIYGTHDATAVECARATSLAQNVPLTFSGRLYLDAGDTISMYMSGCNKGDDLYFSYSGYQMDA